MDIHTYSFIITSEGIKTYRLRNNEISNITDHGEDMSPGRSLSDPLFLEWIKNTIASDDKIDFLIISSEPISDDVFKDIRIKSVEKSAWNNNKIDLACRKHFGISVPLIDSESTEKRKKKSQNAYYFMRIPQYVSESNTQSRENHKEKEIKGNRVQRKNGPLFEYCKNKEIE